MLAHGVAEDHIIGLAMDDNHNKALRNPDRLLAYIDNHIIDDGQTVYVILDEVQEAILGTSSLGIDTTDTVLDDSNKLMMRCHFAIPSVCSFHHIHRTRRT